MEKEECKKYIEKLNREYKENITKIQEYEPLIVQDNNENKDVKGYHGREILELLQNADDAYQRSIDLGCKPKCDLIIEISYKNDIFAISNSGAFFDKEGVKSIVEGNNSTKTGKYIGNKGTGFRSVLNWSKKIRIFSGNFNLEFSKEIADSLMEEIKNEPQIIKQKAKHPNLFIPILSTPKFLEENNQYDKEKTTIELTIDNNRINDNYNVKNQLDNIDHRILLFLPNTSQITIEYEDKQVCFKREKEIIDDDETVSFKKISSDSCEMTNHFSLVEVKKYIDGEKEIDEQYQLFEREIKNILIEDDNKKNIGITIAVPIVSPRLDQPEKRISVTSQHLYSFFPLLKERTPFDCVMHATYDLGSDRNTITKNANNERVFEEQLNFLIEIAHHFSNSNQCKDAIKIVSPLMMSDYCYGFPFTNPTLVNKFRDDVKKIKLLKDLSGNNTSLADNPIFLPEDTPDFIKGDNFSGYVKNTFAGLSHDYIEKLRGTIPNNFSEEDFKDRINEIVDKLNVDNQIELFIWWNEKYIETLPYCIKNRNNDWVENNSECCFIDGTITTNDIPSWVNIVFIRYDYQEALYKATKKTQKYKDAIVANEGKSEAPSRTISQNSFYPRIKFRYLDLSTVVPYINNSVNTYEKAKEYVKWLWENKRINTEGSDSINGDENRRRIQHRFPTVNGDVMVSTNLFIGNVFTRKLFANSDCKEAFIPEDVPVEEYEQFLINYGVLQYPTIEEFKIDDEEYISGVKKTIFEKGYIGKSIVFTLFECYALSINNLDNYLNNLKMVDIVEWIANDTKLNDLLRKKEYTQRTDGRFKIKGNSQRKEETISISQDNRAPNFILYRFNNCKWIEIQGNKYSPKEVLLDKNNSNNGFSGFVNVLDKNTLKDIATSLGKELEEITSIFELFSFAKDITDFDSQTFYEIMLKIPSVDTNGILSNKVYEILEDAGFTKEFDDCDAKKEFFENGQLYTIKNTFALAKETYVPSGKIFNKDKYNILNTGLRTNNENFIRLFGCKRFDENHEIEKSSIVKSDYDDSFQIDFLNLINCAKKYRWNNSNVEKALSEDKLKISLVKRIRVLSSGNEISIDEYSEIRQSPYEWYIYLGESDYKKLYVSNCIENIFANIANSNGFNSDKIGELFRADEETKNYILRKDGKNPNADEEAIKQSFIETLIKKNANFDPNDVKDINFATYEANSEIEKIIQVLKSNGINSVSEFKDLGFKYGFSVNRYYDNKIKEIIDLEKEDYFNFLFNNALDNEAKQNTFISDCVKFDNYGLEGEIDSFIDPITHLINIFGDWKSSDEDLVDHRERYNENYTALNPEHKCEDDISNSSEAKTMIYFNKAEAFNSWLGAKNQENIANEAKDPYSDLKNVVPTKKDIEFKEHSSRDTSGGVVTQKGEGLKKITGNIGELLVYNFLVDTYSKDNVFPKSEAFVKLGILNPGQERSGKCDIEYFDPSKNKRMFVEVKAGNSNGFDISEKELKFAKEKGDAYELYVVFKGSDNQYYFSVLDSRFWENPRYKILNTNYRVVF